MPKALPARDSLPGPPWRTSEARRRPDIRPQLRGTRRCVTGCGLARVSLPATSRGRSCLKPVGSWLGLHASHTARTCACACACACARACARACACACARACARTLAPSVSSISPGRAGAGAKSLRGSPAEGPPLSAEATRRRPLAEQLAFEAPRAGEPCSTAVRIVPFGAFLELLRRLAAAGTSSNLCSDAVALLFKFVRGAHLRCASVTPRL